MISVYTDGSVLFNPGGPGGWAFIIPQLNGEEIVRTGSENSTTNNRMEIRAVLQAIKYIKENGLESCHVYSDSQYIVNTINKWIYSWERYGFRGKKNVDLWVQICDLMKEVDVKATWVPGHSGNEYNEKCDKLAREVYR